MRIFRFRTERLALVAGFLAALAVPARPAQLTDAVRREGEKVIESLRRIEAAGRARRSGSVRRAEFSEGEFNAYIATRIGTERETMLKELAVRLFAENRIEARALIDLSGERLPGGLKPRMPLFFEAAVLSGDGRIKVELQKLFLDGQSVPIPLFDAIIAFAAKIGKSDPGSFKDWYDLPYGLKSLRTEPGRLLVYY